MVAGLARSNDFPLSSTTSDFSEYAHFSTVVDNLRHTFANHAVLQGIPLPVVSRLLGHKRPSMTLRYAHVGDRETEAAAERIGRAIARLLKQPQQRSSFA